MPVRDITNVNQPTLSYKNDNFPSIRLIYYRNKTSKSTIVNFRVHVVTSAAKFIKKFSIASEWGKC